MPLLKITPRYTFLIRRRPLNTVSSKCGVLDVFNVFKILSYAWYVFSSEGRGQVMTAGRAGRRCSEPKASDSSRVPRTQEGTTP